MTTTTLECIIKQQPFFADFPNKHLKLIVSCARNVRFDEGHALFHEGDVADQFYLVREGAVAVSVITPKGCVTVQTVGDGDILGWSALVAPHKMTGIATTRKPTRLIRIQAQPLRELCERDPLLGYRLSTQVVRLLADRLEGARAQLATAD